MNVPVSTVRRSLATLVAVAATSGALVATPAHAGGSDEVRRTGNCSGSADWKLKAKHRDGRIEVEGEIDSNRNGQVWRWKIEHNGTVSARGRGTTKGPSGSFSVERKMADLRGTDRFVFRAVHRASGQVCRGTLSI
jgi:hypothetical protein